MLLQRKTQLDAAEVRCQQQTQSSISQKSALWTTMTALSTATTSARTTMRVETSNADRSVLAAERREQIQEPEETESARTRGWRGLRKGIPPRFHHFNIIKRSNPRSNILPAKMSR